MPHLTRGDLLKSEADRHSRVAIAVTGDIKYGQPVLYTPRGQYLIALSNIEHGKVLVQPHNCVIYQDNIDMDALSAIQVDTGEVDESTSEPIMAPLTIDMLKEQGDPYGIKYISTQHNPSTE